MVPVLDDLDLTPEERAKAEESIRCLAYCHWKQAGGPPNEDLRFWHEAEQEWILFQYVPHRLPPQAAQAEDPDLRSDEAAPEHGSPPELIHHGSLT